MIEACGIQSPVACDRPLVAYHRPLAAYDQINVNVAPAEVFSGIARDNEDFYILESSFFLRPSFLLARSQLGRQPSSILDLVAPSPHRIDSQFLPIFL